MADMYVQKDLQQRTITKEVIRRRQVHECAAENSIPLHRIELSWPARVHEQCSYCCAKVFRTLLRTDCCWRHALHLGDAGSRQTAENSVTGE